MPHLRRHRPTKSANEEKKMIDYINSEISTLIDEHIHNARNRAIMKRRLIDGICYEPLAEEFELSDRQIKTIVYREQSKLFKILENMEKARQ